jgi:hypothetical protein
MLFSLGIGHLATKTFINRLRNWMGSPKSPAALTKEVPPGLTGLIERLFFFTLVGAGVEGYPTAMMAWLAVKLATNWNHPEVKGDSGTDTRAFALSALLAGLISMTFALLGGLLVREFNPQ